MFNNRQQLAEMIHTLMEQHQISMIDAIVHISEKYNVEIDVIAAQIRQSHKLKDLLRQEAIAIKMIRE